MKVHKKDYETFWAVSILGDDGSIYCHNSTWNHILPTFKIWVAIGTKLLVQGTGAQCMTGRRKKKENKKEVQQKEGAGIHGRPNITAKRNEMTCVQSIPSKPKDTNTLKSSWISHYYQMYTWLFIQTDHIMGCKTKLYIHFKII